MSIVNKISISVASDFSKTPGPRYPKEGPFCGEKFRQEVLKPQVAKAINENKKLFVDLDGTAGYGTSFIEEAFGGLIRVDGFTENQLKQILEIKSEEEAYLIDDVWQDIKDAQNAKK